jgi:hypothetical protein
LRVLKLRALMVTQDEMIKKTLSDIVPEKIS